MALKMKRCALWIAGVVLPTLLGCAGGPMQGIDRFFSRENQVLVSEVRRSFQCGTESRETALLLFDSGASFDAWAEARGLEMVGEATLAEGRYALVEMGQRNTGGFGLAVSQQAGRRGEFLLLRATFVTPSAGAMVSQGVTAPCALVRLPETPFTHIELYDQDGMLRATTRP